MIAAARTSTAVATRPDSLLALLGGFRLERGHAVRRLPSSAQRVLAYVALQDGPVGRGVVAAELWNDSPEERANANLRSALWRLGRAEPDLLEVGDGELALRPGVLVDVHDTVCNARRLLRDDGAPGLTALDERQFVRELLPHWFEDWVLFERERLRQLCLHALEALACRLLAERRYGRAVDTALAAVQGEPLRESAHRTLIQIHLAEGNRSEALRQYDRYRQLLRTELDEEPTFTLAELDGDARATRG